MLDHFHVLKSFNDKLSALRRDLFRQATESMQKGFEKNSLVVTEGSGTSGQPRK